jgi:hypothetical protein
VTGLAGADLGRDALQVVALERGHGAHVRADERRLERHPEHPDALARVEGALRIGELEAGRGRAHQHALERGVVGLLVGAGADEVAELVALELLRRDRVAVEVDREQLGRGGELRDVGVGRDGPERRALREAQHRAARDEGEPAPCAPGQELCASGTGHLRASFVWYPRCCEPALVRRLCGIGSDRSGSNRPGLVFE